MWKPRDVASVTALALICLVAAQILPKAARNHASEDHQRGAQAAEPCAW